MNTRRRFVILEHATPDGTVHHDLLIDRPGLPDPLPTVEDDDATTLWAVRIDPPPGDWRGLGELALIPLPPHRRRYLTYEGPLTGGRGTVRRVAAGVAWVRQWDADRAVAVLHMGTYLIQVHIDMTGGDAWAAAVSRYPRDRWM